MSNDEQRNERTVESTLLGAGRSYRYLALATLANAVAVAALTRAAIAARPTPSSAWACITVFFVLRISFAAGRIFGTRRGGLGFDRCWRAADVAEVEEVQ